MEYIEDHENGESYYLRHIAGVALQRFYDTTEIIQTDYLIKDHLGSIHTVVQQNGSLERTHFGAFGERVDDLDWQTSLGTAALTCPRREASAAIYAHGFAKNHCFRDGNKRVTQVAASLFLELNGRVVDFATVEAQVKAVHMMEGLADSTVDEAEFQVWLKENSMSL